MTTLTPCTAYGARSRPLTDTQPEKKMTMQWQRNQAYGPHGIVFSVEREKHGWYLYRYTERSGQRVFKSKEKVRSLRAGKAYAEKLWSLSGGRSDTAL